jgi:hypothetical protein
LSAPAQTGADFLNQAGGYGMVFHSNLPRKQYMRALIANMSSHFALGQERFTGFFIGNLFYVTYHSGREWNHKITNQKNAAVGFLKKAKDGCDVHFIRFRGLLCPTQFLLYWLLVALVALLGGFQGEVWNEEAMRNNLIFVSIFMAIYAPIYTLFESATDASEEGRRVLLSCLLDPTDPYANIDQIP